LVRRRPQRLGEAIALAGGAEAAEELVAHVGIEIGSSASALRHEELIEVTAAA
jgi:hypothetical protein